MTGGDWGAELKRARESMGLTQRDVAEHVGVAHAKVVSRWERGAYRPAPENMGPLTRLLGVAPPGDGWEPRENGRPKTPEVGELRTDEQAVERAASCILAADDADGAYLGPSADDVVSEYVGRDRERWIKLLKRAHKRARERRPRVYSGV